MVGNQAIETKPAPLVAPIARHGQDGEERYVAVQAVQFGDREHGAPHAAGGDRGEKLGSVGAFAGPDLLHLRDDLAADGGNVAGDTFPLGVQTEALRPRDVDAGDWRALVLQDGRRFAA